MDNFDKITTHDPVQCERLCQETDSWLIICAQHPGGAPTLHYTSDRMRREAIGETTEIVAKFQDLAIGLNRARIMNIRDLDRTYQEKLSAARMEQDAAEDGARLARDREQQALQEAENARAKVLAQKALIARYEAQLVDLRARPA